jgi:CRP-like cAMP-binding protein
LLRLAGERSDRRCYLPTRDDIGAMLGITSETASRVVADFKRGGLVRELDAKHARVEPEGLEQIAQR